MTMLGLRPCRTRMAWRSTCRTWLLTNGMLFESLAGKRVLLAGLLAPRLRDVWATPEFRSAYSAWGDTGQIRVIAAVATRPREDGGAVRDYKAILSEIRGHDFDVALLACGAAAKPLAWELRNVGRTALDVGLVFDALVGNPEREVRPYVRDATWPEENWLPR